MTRIDPDCESAREKLRQQQEALRRSRLRLEEMGLSETEVERALGPIILFQTKLWEEIELYEYARQDD